LTSIAQDKFNASNVLVAWMKNYKGHYDKNGDIIDQPKRGGKYVQANGEAHESCNFLPAKNGLVFGHVETWRGTGSQAGAETGERLLISQHSRSILNLKALAMQTEIEELTSRLVQLPKQQRLEIVRFLLFLDSQSSEPGDASSAWEAEIADRIRAVKDGTAVGIDYDEALRSVRARFMQ
jgi:hypothetical protein